MEMTPVHYTIWRTVKGGVELSINHYIDHFNDNRKIHIFSLRPVENTIYDESKVIYYKGDFNNLKCYWKFVNHCRKNKDHIFHIKNVGPIILCIALLAGVKKIIYHIHGTIYWNSLPQKIALKTVWYISKLLATSRDITFLANSAYSAGIFREKVLPITPIVVYNGFNVESFYNKRSLRSNPVKLAYVGRLNPGKNVDIIIKLFEEIALDFPNTELLIAGDGILRTQLEEQAKNSPFSQRIKFEGFINDIASFYASIDLLLFISDYESFGNVLAEALLTGAPVLTSDIPVFKEIYGNEADFLLGVPQDFQILKQRFYNALNNYDALAKKAFDLSDVIKEKFSISKHLSTIENIYGKN